LRGAEKASGVDLGDFTAGGKSDGDGGSGNVLSEFGDGEDIVRIHSKEGSLDFAAEGFDGTANTLEAVLGILHDASPSVIGEADLVAKEGLENPFLEGRAKVFCNYAPGRDSWSSKR
jgi:hypothetical protein